MPLSPTLKTWDPVFHGSNTPSGTLKPDIDAVFLLAKNALKAGTTPCTVSYSCNGATAGTVGDGVDRITTTGNIVNAVPGSPHSWEVLNLVGMGSAQVLFSWEASQSTLMKISFSPGGLFTGGSTTASPTASDAQVLITTGTEWAGNPGSTGTQYRVHITRTADGANTRVFICGNSLVAGFWSFEKAYNAVSGWTLPYMACVKGIGNNFTSTSLLNFTNWVYNANYLSQGPVAAMALTLTMEAMSTGNPNAIGNRLAIVNEISNEYPLPPVGLWHETTVGQRGRHGMVPDMYFAATVPVMGDTYPANGSKLWQQMGQMIVPSDGSTWLIS